VAAAAFQSPGDSVARRLRVAVAEVLGPFWGGLIISLPISAGPTYVFLSMRHGPDFVAASALSSFAANAATTLFLIVYGVLARRMSAWPCLVVAVLAWLAGSLATHLVMWTPATAFVLNLALYAAGFALLDTSQGTDARTAPRPRRRRFDLLARAVAVAAFVTFVVSVSSILGPDATGIAAVFPISLTSLFVIVRPRIGGRASSVLAANALRAMPGFAMTLLTLHLAIRPWGTATALVLALLVSVSWSATLLLLRRWRQVA